MTGTKTIHRYMPELESVTVSEPTARYVSWVAIVVFGAIAGAFVTLVYALIRHYFGPGWPEMRVWLPMGAVLSLIAGYLLAGASWFNYVMSTDSTGITTRGLRNTNSAAWSDITSLQISQNGSGMQCKVFADRKKITLATMGQSGIALFASVLQYADRHNIPVHGHIPAMAESLWTPIPDSIPQEMDWHNPKSIDRHTALSGAIVLGSLILLAIYAVWRMGYIEHLYRYSSHVVGVIIGGVAGAFHSRFLTAQSVSVRMDRFEARTLLASVYVPWSQIKSAQIVKNNFVIDCGGFRKTVMIPCDIDSDATVKVILSAVRRLRSSESPLPVLITGPLASVKYLVKPVEDEPDVADDDFVETQVPRALAAAPLVILAAIAVAVFFVLRGSAEIPRMVKIMGWVLIPQALFLFLYVQGRYTRVDRKGITRRAFWRTRFVSWDEVASYSVEYRAEPTGWTVFHLRDAAGGRLITLSCADNNPSHLRLKAFVERMLRDVPRERHESKRELPLGL